MPPIVAPHGVVVQRHQGKPTRAPTRDAAGVPSCMRGRVRIGSLCETYESPDVVRFVLRARSREPGKEQDAAQYLRRSLGSARSRTRPMAQMPCK
jgi:hypothetical protein